MNKAETYAGMMTLNGLKKGLLGTTFRGSCKTMCHE